MSTYDRVKIEKTEGLHGGNPSVVVSNQYFTGGMSKGEIFSEYPDVVKVKKLYEMLGGAGRRQRTNVHTPAVFGIKIDVMLKQPNCPFVLYVGTRKPVKRRQFETYLSEKAAI